MSRKIAESATVLCQFLHKLIVRATLLQVSVLVAKLAQHEPLTDATWRRKNEYEHEFGVGGVFATQLELVVEAGDELHESDA